jgi:hypothetical protein
MAVFASGQHQQLIVTQPSLTPPTRMMSVNATVDPTYVIFQDKVLQKNLCVTVSRTMPPFDWSALALAVIEPSAKCQAHMPHCSILPDT